MRTVANGALNAQDKLMIDQAITQYSGHPGALLGILETVQAANAHKFLSMDSLRYIADEPESTRPPPSMRSSTSIPRATTSSASAAEPLATPAVPAICSRSCASIWASPGTN